MAIKDKLPAWLRLSVLLMILQSICEQKGFIPKLKGDSKEQRVLADVRADGEYIRVGRFRFGSCYIRVPLIEQVSSERVWTSELSCLLPGKLTIA